MARTGRPRLPVELHVLRGTYRKDRHGLLPPLVATSTAPVLTTDAVPADVVAGLSAPAQLLIGDVVAKFGPWDAASFAVLRAYARSTERLEVLQTSGRCTPELAREVRINVLLFNALNLER